MRAGGLLLLLVAFAVGIGSAFVVAYFTLDAKPIEVVDRGPTVKILVAKLPIAVGEEITAEAVIFQDVFVAELPEGAISNFFHAYRRRPAYPISPGCPICEDLLISQTTDTEETVKYIPVGSQIVVLEVEQVRVDDGVSDVRLPITQVLSTADSLDVRVVLRHIAQGEMVERKNTVLRTYADEKDGQREENGKLVLENVPIHDVRSSGQAVEGRQYQTVSLLLENDEVEKLYQAANMGRLRIALRTNLTAEFKAEPTPEVVEEANPMELQAVVEPDTSLQVVSEPVAAPTPQVSPQPIRLIGLPIVQEEPLVAVEAQEVSVPPISHNLTFVSPKGSTDIRNEAPVVETPAIVIEKATGKSAVVGLMYPPDVRPMLEYSPFGVKSRSVKPVLPEPTVPKPLTMRERFEFK